MIERKIIKVLSTLIIVFVFIVFTACVIYALAIAFGDAPVEEEYKDVYHQIRMEQMIQ